MTTDKDKRIEALELELKKAKEDISFITNQYYCIYVGPNKIEALHKEYEACAKNRFDVIWGSIKFRERLEKLEHIAEIAKKTNLHTKNRLDIPFVFDALAVALAELDELEKASHEQA